MDYLTRCSLTASINLAYRSRSLAGAIAELASSVDDLSGKDAAIDKRLLGQIIHLAEIADDYSDEIERRLEVMANRYAGSQNGP